MDAPQPVSGHLLGLASRPEARSRARKAIRTSGSLAEAQQALLARARWPIAVSGTLAALALAAVGAGARGGAARAGALVLAAILAGFCRRSGTRPAAWALGYGLVWSALVLWLLPALGPEARATLAAISTGLLAALVLAAPVLPVAAGFAVPVAAAAIAAAAALPAPPLRGAVLLALPTGLLALILCVHRLLRSHLVQVSQSQDRREFAQAELAELQETANSWLWASNEAGRLTMLTASLADRIGLAQSDLQEVLVCNLLDRQRDTNGAAARIVAAFDRHEAFREVVVPLEINGRSRFVSISGRPVEQSGVFMGYQGVGIDVTEAHQNQVRIAYLALNDSLTALPNRTSFERRLAAACEAGWLLALLCISLSDFQAINATLGPQAGDELLVAFSRRLRAAVRATDIVARLGGGEFGVLVEGLDRERVAELAARIAGAAGAPYRLSEVDAAVASGINVGVALAPADATDAAGLQRNATLALAAARREGNGQPRFFAPDMLAELQQQRELESDLRQALSRGELAVCYHPIVDLHTRAVISAEALLRWHHPRRGIVPPSTFIPIAESAGLIVPIGRFVMAEACRQAHTWREDMRVAVNVSPAQFRDEALLASIDAAIEQSGLPPAQLELEITESVLLEASRSTLGVLRGIRERGIRIALDDFGTGYSSLRYLRSFPFDKVKIDASFVRDIAHSEADAAIVRAIVGLAASFGMRTTAEGVETEAQREALCGFRCDEGQGYLFSQVRDAASMLAFVGARQNREPA